MMKVLIVLPALAGAGAEIFVSRLTMALNDRDVDVRLYLLSGCSDSTGEKVLSQLISKGVYVYVNSNQNSKSIAGIAHFLLSVLRWKPNVIFSNLFISKLYALITRLIFFYRDIKYVHRIENTVIYTGRNRVLLKVIDYFQDTTIVISPPVDRSYSNFIGKKSVDKIKLIPNGVVFPNNCVVANGLISQGDSNNNCINICHIGRITKNGFLTEQIDSLETTQKGHATMIRTISLFSKAHPNVNVHLYCAGDGDLKSEAEQYASSLDSQSKITFLGRIDNPFDLLQCVDIFFFPSKFEGMPNALIEAAVSGLPVIASDIPEHDWLKPDEGWLLCSPEDEFCFLNALEQMIANIEFYKSVARDNSIQFRDEFSIDKTANLYLDAFYEVF